MIRYFALHPTAANLLMLAVAVVGLLSLSQLRRETFPDFTPAEVVISLPYPGATALDVEEAVCQRVEDGLEGLADVAETECTASEGLGQVVATMAGGADPDRFLNDVRTEVEAIDSFPDEVETPVVTERNRTDFVTAVALTGPMALTDLKAYAEDLKERWLKDPLVSQISIEGFSQRQFRVHVDRMALHRYGLTVGDVANAITAQSLDRPAGTLETGDGDFLVRFAEGRRAPRDFDDLVVVGAESGAEVPLAMIARVDDRFETPETAITFDDKRAALLRISKTKQQDTLRVMGAVRTLVDRELAQAPEGVRLVITQDISSLVADRLSMLTRNGIQGVVLVFLVLWLFFGLRYAFWVAAGLPVAFLGTLFVMQVMGYSLNMISMVGLLIAIGLMMDDAIVLAENIAVHLRKGDDALTAAVAGTREVAAGVLSSFATTLCVFLPLAFIEGDIGKVLRVLPVVLITTLAVSLVEAFLILPHHLGHAGQADRPGAVRRAFDARFDWLRTHVVGRVAAGAVRWRYLTVGLAGMAFLTALSLPASGLVKTEAFPSVDGDVASVYLLLPQGTPPARTEQVVGRLTEALSRINSRLTPEQPGETSLVRHVTVEYGRDGNTGETGAHAVTLTVDLLSAEERTTTLTRFLDLWRQEAGPIPDVSSLIFREFSIGPGGLPIEIRLKGDDLETLDAAAESLKEWLAGYEGVYDLTDTQRPGKPEMQITLRPGAVALGVTGTMVAEQVRGALFGQVADEVQIGPESYEVDVRLAPEARDSLGALEDFRLTLPSGALVPLGVVAHLSEARGPARILRYDGQRTVTITGDVDTRVANADAVVADTMARFIPELEARHPGVTVALEGQSAEADTTRASIQRGFLMGLIGVYLLLSFQFRSYILPVVVMVIIPFALIGVLVGHLLMGFELSMPSIMGFASLAGVVVNDSILLVIFLRRNAGEGLDVAAAAAQASQDRFRAITLTSLTTITGLLPLLLEQSLQAQVLQPLVISLAGGLLATTVLVLFVVPAFYVILHDFGLGRDTESTSDKASPP